MTATDHDVAPVAPPAGRRGAMPAAALLLALWSPFASARSTDPAVPAADPAYARVVCCSPAALASLNGAAPPPLPPAAATDRFRRNALLSAYAGVVGVYGYFSWWNKKVDRHVVAEDGSVSVQTFSNRTSNFRVSHEGWFGQHTVNGGADKLGHAFSSYVGLRLLSAALQNWAESPRDEAIRVAGVASAAVALGVEMLDGFTLEYGFSTSDLVMNLVGVGVGMLLESSPQWDDLIDFRWQYRPSGDAKNLGQRDPIGDYSGQTYLLVLKASGVPQLRTHPWLRYAELQFGYGSRGYAPHPGWFAPELPYQHRNLYFGIGLNLSELLGAKVFRERRSRTRWVTENFLEYVQIPGTNVLIRHGLDDR